MPRLPQPKSPAAKQPSRRPPLPPARTPSSQFMRAIRATCSAAMKKRKPSSKRARRDQSHIFEPVNRFRPGDDLQREGERKLAWNGEADRDRDILRRLNHAGLWHTQRRKSDPQDDRRGHWNASNHGGLRWGRKLRREHLCSSHTDRESGWDDDRVVLIRSSSGVRRASDFHGNCEAVAPGGNAFGHCHVFRWDNEPGNRSVSGGIATYRPPPSS